jgi:hypothetical protein
VAIVLLGLVMLDISLAATVGSAAERKGRSYKAWFWISLFSGCLVPALVVATMGPRPARVSRRLRRAGKAQPHIK